MLLSDASDARLRRLLGQMRVLSERTLPVNGGLSVEFQYLVIILQTNSLARAVLVGSLCG